MTYLTVAIMVDTVETAIAQAAIAAERGADLVEFRIDRLPQAAEQVGELVSRSPLPCIVTCRPDWEGGEYDGEEADRQAIIAAALDAQPAYLDLEVAAYRVDPAWRQIIDNRRETSVILSSHDFQTRPADLLRRISAMAEVEACHVVKLAWRARSLRDNLEAFELLGAPPKRMIALCMGEPGQPSRVLAKKFGALLTFAGLEDDTVTAPGQVGVQTLKQLYRWDAIDRDTQVFGVVGFPVGHSLSPHIMNAGFTETGHNGVYLPLPIPDDYVHFKATVGSWLDFAPLDFRGASVTIPHKHNLLKFAAERNGEIEPLAQQIGAANTLTVRDDGSIFVSNTDYAAVLDSVCAAMGIERESLAGKRVAILGAGGAARAAAAGFAHYGARVTVYNRTLAKAEKLAGAFENVTAAPLEAIQQAEADILVNCTPIGMHPNTDATPLPDWPDSLGKNTIVFDTIYNPMQTKLLADAAARGCVTITGVEMFVRQAAAQFQQWTGQPAPTQTFEQVIRERLNV
ncbi:type I 3-dehydroquinate dehydratase [Planctomycetales bacterium ZRK34]|nr:type I 3-dehydroquinate dehydratase [Planctomycetales bacterium ZRK34]